MNFIFVISHFLIPWTSINLVDYYLLRRGQYNVKDIFDVNGQYGKVNKINCLAFAVSIVAEIPFVNTSFYIGPITKAFGGADIVWLIGIIVPLILYYFSIKKKLNKKVICQKKKKRLCNIEKVILINKGTLFSCLLIGSYNLSYVN